RLRHGGRPVVLREEQNDTSHKIALMGQGDTMSNRVICPSRLLFGQAIRLAMRHCRSKARPPSASHFLPLEGPAMLTFLGRRRTGFCDQVARRDFLRVGALTVGGLGMADVLRLQAQAANLPAVSRTAPAAGKSVIMVFLHGGPTHLDMYDMKPAAPVEFRGEF